MDSIRIDVGTFILALLLLFQFACTKEEPQASADSKSAQSGLLRLAVTKEFRSSGLEATIIPEFEKELKCKVELRLYENHASLAQGFIDAADSLDVVLGIPSAFSAFLDPEVHFSPYLPKAVDEMNRDCVEDQDYRLIPYGFSYLGLLYNSELLAEAPKSFGELQDDKYLNQMAMVDPSHSGPGRAMLHWCMALFGKEGYPQMLRALRKNVFRNYSSQAEALAAVNSGECTMMPGLITLAARQNEQMQETSKLDFKVFSEGSYLYSECIAILQESQNPALAGAFVDFILRESAQKMIVYKLGLFPANRKTLLPTAFSRVPLSPWLVNSSLTNVQIAEHTEEWLDDWALIFGGY
ncbi:MAG: thiamine ABC transporter substrate-binding protein [Candidatus Cloacimonetes bacterium]|jgi:ABC transporter substrate-binding protein (ThiB subfamily)|nr:thiamine ABC transporter substrate-binding protein [Candidatus Cloacimonadota bacterium]MDD2506043.1 thiamine ABC transporter substrate-binding protein [Candidatus Cloacimonadota bacterium]MDD4146912.1 thiamine ABC transporter substrate-binding protein [Candidatus Cloacimonadota bacterium]MDD4559567.1 thiamine ABC transporter substrate-binding protein [Candidatus Cloacimonadota bacterium]